MEPYFTKEEVEQSISHRFEAIVRQYPNLPAVKDTRETLSYEALNQAANRAAHAILTQHGKKDGPVAVLLEHDTSVMIALLGILKAGRAYTVLDPSFPHTRLTAILEDLRTDILITNDKSLERAEELAVNICQVINLDRLVAHFSDQNHEQPIPSKALAGIFYTSGSTGKPKGVMRSQRTILHRVWLETTACTIDSSDNISLLYSCTYGASVTDIFGALLNGATLCLYNVKANGIVPLSGWLQQEKITLLHLPVALFRQLLDTLTGGEDFRELRQITPSGQLFKGDVERLRAYFPPDCTVIQRFSSTETSIVTRFVIDPQTVIHSNIVPVGYAVEDKIVLLLDDTGKPVGVDQVGEIAVKSRYLSPGYWRKPELTQQIFSSDPGDSDTRIYHTGDLGRMGPDGCLEFLGRKDFQIKIRGYRVELAEIESALYELAEIKEAVIVAHKSQYGENRLVAYLVSREQRIPSIDTIRTILKDRLPEYMIPAYFMMLEALPLTPTGKVDRQALPEPERTRPVLATPFIPPATEPQQQVAQIWREVLELDQVGLYDNFFELGGHSLHATRIVSQLQRTLHIDVPLPSIFDLPTIAEFAAFVTGHRIPSSSAGSAPSSSVTPDSPIPRQALSGEYPVSFAQQRMWVLQQFEPDLPVYNQPKVMRLHGPLKCEALRQALDALIRRHEPFRTTFPMAEGSPVAIVAEQWHVDLPVEDLREQVSKEAQDVEVQRLIKEEIQRPFALTRDLMIRGTLIQLGETDWLFVLVTHHIATDYWSTGILRRELGILYDTFAQDRPSPLPELPVRYGDFARWQRAWVTEEILASHLCYWQQQLGGELPVLHLPTDHPRPVSPSYQGARQSRILPEHLLAGLGTICHQEQVTLFMTVTAAFFVFLFRYTGQDDLIIGTPIAGRRPETEGLIGCFLNMLALRTTLAGNPTFRDLLQRVRTVTIGAYTHQAPPFEWLVDRLQVARGAGHLPVFHVLLDFLNVPETSLTFSELGVTPVEAHNPLVLYDLALFVRQRDQGLEASIAYNSDLFEAATITRMLGHFQTVLEGIVADPEQRIQHLPLLPDTEYEQIVVAWNATQTEFPHALGVHQLFEQQAARHPDTLALQCHEQQLTYRVLHTQMNQLAQYLRARGVGPEIVVGLCLERSPEMVIGLLGILKAGGAYLPLDPTSPTERLRGMIEETGLSLVVTQASLLDKLSTLQTDMLCLDRDWNAIAGDLETGPPQALRPNNLAYIIYTSGSTGTPKGVLIAHRGLQNVITALITLFDLQPGSRVLHLVSISFDAATAHLLMTLCSGATLYLATRDELVRESGVPYLVHTHQITHANMPVSLLAALSVDDLSGLLHTIAVGAEACTLDLAERWVKGHRLFDVYGPTEATICATNAEYREGEQQISIGRPLANTRLYILDAHQHTLPVGIPGELYLGGIGLARGYLQHPDLTAERFLPDPFSGESGSRLYQTGDIGRYLPDGTIEFLGRRDHQVKLRGFRIELGEIETTLRQHPSLQEAVVVLLGEMAAEKRLVAYVIPDATVTPTHDELRRFLRQQLPEYMLPSGFIFLDALPLTPNGKVDRAALAVLEPDRPELTTPYVAPRDEVERHLVTVCETLLETQPIGVEDDLFALGIHSIQALRLLGEIEQLVTHPVTPELLQQATTIAQLAQRIVAETASLSAAGTPSASIPRRSRSSRSRRHRRFRLEDLFLAWHVPYPLGTRLLAWFCGTRLAQGRYFPRGQVANMRNFLTSVDCSHRESAILPQHLMSNFLHKWRAAALTRCSPSCFDRWITITGEFNLQPAQQRERGLIVLSSHFGPRAPIGLLFERWGIQRALHFGWRGDESQGAGRHILARAGSPQQEFVSVVGTARVAALYRAKQRLMQQGVVHLAPDGAMGSQAIEVAFLGRRRPFHIGFAELAVLTEAMVLPVFTSMNVSGYITVDVLSPLDIGTPAMTDKTRVTSLIKQYASLLEHHWRDDPGNIATGQLRKFLRLPIVNTT